MKNSGKIFMWVLIIAIVLLIAYLILMKKEPATKVNLFNSGSGINNNPSSGTTNTDNTNNQLPIPSPTSSTGQTFSIGNNIYAGADLTNTYTTCSPSTSNIDNTYSNGDLIGTFLRKEGSCIVIAVDTYPLGFSWIPIKGSKNVYLPINTLLYETVLGIR